MKILVKFLSVVILFLSSTIYAQRIYKITIKNDTLFIESIDYNTENGIIIQTDSTPIFEFYDVNSKLVLGVEKRSDFTDDTITKFMDMNDGDTKISDRLKYSVEGDSVEFFYYTNTLITNYFTPQLLEKTTYVLKIKDSKETNTYIIENGQIKKETF
jgi:hypothetical protein